MRIGGDVGGLTWVSTVGFVVDIHTGNTSLPCQFLENRSFEDLFTFCADPHVLYVLPQPTWLCWHLVYHWKGKGYESCTVEPRCQRRINSEKKVLQTILDLFHSVANSCFGRLLQEGALKRENLQVCAVRKRIKPDYLKYRLWITCAFFQFLYFFLIIEYGWITCVQSRLNDVRVT